MRIPYGWSISGILLALSAALPAQSTAAAHPKVVLVELFTSEGCSSCPPADALLRQLNGTQTSAGQLIVGISEHVTYWNSLGWSDPYSAQEYTDRQNAYGTHFGLDSVYTPQMVVNGREQFVGSDRGALEKALRKEQDQATPVELHILSTAIAKNFLTVRFAAAGDGTLHGAEIVAVLADDADQSSVLRGENSGRTLAHVAVARLIARVAKLDAAGEQTVQVKIPASMSNSQKHHVILFAQKPGHGAVLGADSSAF